VDVERLLDRRWCVALRCRCRVWIARSGSRSRTALVSRVTVRQVVASRGRGGSLTVVRVVDFLLAFAAVASALALLGAVLRVGLVASAVGELAITILCGHDLLDLRGSLAHVRNLFDVPILNVLLEKGSFLRGVGRVGEARLVVIAAKDEDLFPSDIGDGPGVCLGIILAPDDSVLVV